MRTFYLFLISMINSWKIYLSIHLERLSHEKTRIWKTNWNFISFTNFGVHWRSFRDYYYGTFSSIPLCNSIVDYEKIKQTDHFARFVCSNFFFIKNHFDVSLSFLQIHHQDTCGKRDFNAQWNLNFKHIK
jgi:hypothetical protein